MKHKWLSKIIFPFILLTLLGIATPVAAAALWITVGSPAFSAGGEIYYISLAIDSSGAPYVAYVDKSNQDKATVMKFNGTNWEPVGSGGSSAAINNSIAIAIDGNDVPYVAYQDYNVRPPGKVTVMRFNGTSWEAVGPAGFSAGWASSISLAIDGSGVPYVAYQDDFNSYKITVMKFNGTSWETVGPAGFSAGEAYLGRQSLAFDSNNVPYVVYEADDSRSYKATVMKFNGTNWELVGSGGFSSGAAVIPSIAIDNSGVPYVVYQDVNKWYKATVKKFNGTNWETVGSAGFSTGEACSVTIAIDKNGVPYVAYEDCDNGHKGMVMKFNGTSWTVVSGASFSVKDAYSPYIAIDNSNIPYVAYGDFGTGIKATVVKLAFSSVTTRKSIASQDGWILETQETTNTGGQIDADSITINIGDEMGDKQYRAILSFNTKLPPGAVITKAMLKFKYAGMTGISPFLTHGKLLVDVKKGVFSNNPVLAKGDFNAGANKSALFALSANTSLWFNKAFSAPQFAYINKAGVTQFRLRFTKDDDDDIGADFIQIYSGSARTNAPQLIIEYYVP